VNFDFCETAVARRDVEVPVGEPFVCPECGKPLKPPPVSKTSARFLGPAVLGFGIVMLAGGAMFLGMRLALNGGLGSGPSSAPQAGAPAVAVAGRPNGAAPTASVGANVPPPALLPVTTLFRVAGDTAAASPLLQPLAKAYLSARGDFKPYMDPAGAIGTVGTQAESGQFTASGRDLVAIADTGVDAGLQALKDGKADLVVSMGRLSDAQRASIGSLGDMASPAAEHLAGTAVYAVVVSPINPLPSLTLDQVHGIFSVQLTDWAKLGQAAAGIQVYAPRSVLEDAPLEALLGIPASIDGLTSMHLSETQILSDGAPIADAHDIGVVAAANIGSARVVPIVPAGGGQPVGPLDKAAVASGAYPLAEPVYFYTAPRPLDPAVQKFVDLATAQAGPAAQAPAAQPPAPPPAPAAQATAPEAAAPADTALPATASDKLRQFLAGAKRLGVDFRFNPNSTDPDLKARRDIDRVINYILSNHYNPDQIILVGFADNHGDAARNIAMSRKRADVIADLFAARGLRPGKVAGFGADLPIADNGTDAGRERNRRVEIYIRQ
jgi:phosphate transport system substrate-binding protein